MENTDQLIIQNDFFTFLFIFINILILIIISNIFKNSILINKETIRKFIHFFVGILCSFSPFYFQSNYFPLFLAILFLATNIYANFKNNIFFDINFTKRISYGTIYFPLAYFIQVVFFWNYKEYFTLSFLLLTICDPIASIIGNRIQNNNSFIIWEDKKTYWGTFSFFITSIVLSFIFAFKILNFSLIDSISFSIFITIGTTIAEITSSKGTDNLSIPLTSILLMFSFENQNVILYKISDIIINHSNLYILVLILFSITYHLKLLSISGYFGGLIMATIITFLGGLKFLSPMIIFFILSSLLSSISNNLNIKNIIKPKRSIAQVYANGGIGLLICIYNYFYPHYLNYYLFLSSISAANADTWATEIGKWSKNNPISIINLKKMEKGLSGGITLLGILGSIGGAFVLNFIFWIIYKFPNEIFILITISGILGSILDSILGATIQVKYIDKNNTISEKYNKNSKILSGYKLINNDLVNLLNTAFSPIFFYILLRII